MIDSHINSLLNDSELGHSLLKLTLVLEDKTDTIELGLRIEILEEMT